jgi:predicted nucleic acid-binding protein
VGVQFNSDISVDFWKQVSRYKANIRRISLADCFALTLANREGGILVTSDRKEFEPVVPLNICQINLIR